MSTYFKHPRGWKLRAAASIVAITQLMAPLGAIAQVATASTVIQSRASASYVDNDGVTQVATSNIVQTTVQQVGAYAVSPGGSKYAASGAPVAVMHSITNSGNGSDTFTIEVQDAAGIFASVDVFADADANGLADNTSSLLVGGAINGGSTASRSTNAISVAAGSTFNYVVVYTLPTTAGSGWVGSGRVEVTPANTGIGYVDASLEVTDTITRTAEAAFSAALTHSAPLVPAAGGGSWGATPSSGPQGTLTTYTFTYTNNGSSAGQIYLRDELPAALNFQTGTAVWSSQPGVALLEAGTFGAPASATEKIAFKVDGQVVEAMIKDVPAGHSGTVSFQVLVSNTATPGQHVSQGRFSLESCVATDIDGATGGTGCGTGGTTGANAIFTVLANFGLQFGNQPAGTADTIIEPRVMAGGAVKFTIPVTNSGSAADAFKVSIDEIGSTFPPGTRFTWYHADGSTPLQFSTGDTRVDTGTIAPGATVNVVLQAIVPANTLISATANLTAVASAVSASDATATDTVTLTVTEVVAMLVDLTSTDVGEAGKDIGPGGQLNVVSQTLTVAAGGQAYTSAGAPDVTAGRAVYDLFVSNNDTSDLTFNLDSSVTSTFPGNLPAGWTVRYHAFNGDVATSVAGPTVTTVTVPAGTQGHVVAVVIPAATAAEVTGQDIYFRVRSTTASAVSNSIVSDYIRTAINVTSATSRSFILSPVGSSLQIAPGGVVSFAHSLLNNGSQACGITNGLSLTAALPTQAQADGWTVVVYEDNGSTPGQIDSTDTVLLDTAGTFDLGALNAGASRPLLVRVFAPGSAAGGSSVSVTLTVTDTDTGAPCGTQSLVDVVNVTVGQLVVNKVQVLDALCNVATEPTSAATISAKPGECIVYSATVKNNGTAPVTNVSLNDVVPPFTTYHATQSDFTAQCEATGLRVGGTDITPIPAVTPTADGALICGTGSLPNELIPGGTITLRYRVMVNAN